MKEVKDDIKELRKDIREMATSVTRIATAVESDLPQLKSELKSQDARIRKMELERARESTARDWLQKNWIVLAGIIALLVSESAILAKLI